MEPTTVRVDPVRGDGDGGRNLGSFRLEPPGRRVQVPQLLVAVLVVAVSALAGVVLFSQASSRDPVLALARDVQRGEVVEAEDFRVAYVGTDDPVATVSSDGLTSLVGLASVTDLEAGTIVTRAQFVARQPVETGEAVVGLALSPGEYPTLRLAVGDRVDVIGAASAVTGAPGGVLVAGAEVFDIVELGAQGERFVSLRMPSEAAAAVAGAAEGEGLRLVLVGGTP